MAVNYKDTLNLPSTGFSMKADLVQKEPRLLKLWQDEKLYESIRKARKGKKRFVLHDGPPYANGHIHMGHVLNKILKDIVVKFYTMNGFDSPFIPGWDCHGLPVEHQLFKELNISKYDIDQTKFRKKAKDYAMKFVEIQRREFERLGVLGDWDKPYLTLDPKYEGAIVRSFASLVRDGYIYKALKPVNWCIDCETALAEAEVEYEEHASPAIYVKFKSKKEPGTYFIIWTTTPWTLLGNVAVAVHPDMDYAVLKVGNENWIMLESLAAATMDKLTKPLAIIKKIRGKDLEGTVCLHPFIERDSKVVLADYISSLEGTGCVHTAPGHGQEDYITGRKYNLPVIMPVSAKGQFDKTCGDFSGMGVHEANPKILERLKKEKALLHSENITHSYPHCWRCKKPIIFRATEQYFANVDHEKLRERMLKVIRENVKWYPEIGESRISAMVENRPDWCLSRQRYWGVPIIAFKCKKCEAILLDHAVIEHVGKIIEKEGSQAWFARSEKELMPQDSRCRECGNSEFSKEKDIIDVWFESGVSYKSVLMENQMLGFPCQLYLEGSDQHRGWFQSALITSCAIEKKPPYEGVLTHGFVVDGERKKMSKSLGNVISPQDVMKTYGADILRLWVASSDYRDDVRLSGEILERLADAYRKIRNTFRYLLGNVRDFDPKKDCVKPAQMTEIDRWMLSRLADFIAESKKNYEDYLFFKIFRSAYNFCVYEISSLYLDILKDRLYTFEKKSRERRSCQTVLHEVLVALLKILAPVISFTTEEAYRELKKSEGSVHLAEWHWTKGTLCDWKNKALDEKWASLIEVREEVMKVLESERMSGKIGSSLEAKIILYTDNDKLKALLREKSALLSELFITSQAEFSEGPSEGMVKSGTLPLWVAARKADGKKCARCWKYSAAVGDDKGASQVCENCAAVIRGIKGEKEKV